MRIKTKAQTVTYIAIAVAALSLLVTFSVLAGNIDSPDVPGATNSYDLADIFYRLLNGSTGSQSNFTEPVNGPGSTMADLNAIMAQAPAVDNTNGAGVAHVASGKTFWGLTSGAWGLQTGTAVTLAPASVPKTGQINFYATGDDGDLQKGVAWPDPRFNDNGDGTMTDDLTGLIWLQDASCANLAGTDTDGKGSWSTGLSAANSLADGTCGLTDGSIAGDWRLPNVRELHSLVHYGVLSSANWLNTHPFFGAQSSYYWTSTSLVGSTSFAWSVDLDDGYVYETSKFNDYYVRPVRGGQ